MMNTVMFHPLKLLDALFDFHCIPILFSSISSAKHFSYWFPPFLFQKRMKALAYVSVDGREYWPLYYWSQMDMEEKHVICLVFTGLTQSREIWVVTLMWVTPSGDTTRGKRFEIRINFTIPKFAKLGSSLEVCKKSPRPTNHSLHGLWIMKNILW